MAFFYVLNFFSATYSFPQPKMRLKCPFITNLVPENRENKTHKKFVKIEERKVKNIEKIYCCWCQTFRGEDFLEAVYILFTTCTAQLYLTSEWCQF